MADTTVISLRFKNDQYDKIKAQANFNGVSITTYMRQAVLEHVENETDYQNAAVNLKASHGKTVSRAEVMARLGMKP
ncbi:type II toxin-antitoxin system RelB family antitoxin [Secundilactobacillus mixtipabuli]|uniref:CopG family transcriptional regulator n=1 Tax=Secundilactobacillus mixtipabuli TaxID=1435342 RepID=A0A1Z5I9S1_9LACO|nr:DUF6290 family protein [Secundilactobacillus mixtipabuli]GAW98533.1 hypothetical protein IWT30_00478 [Secundilactobacillus mixtipabuli]